MQGSIRLVVGLILVFGAVGGLDYGSDMDCVILTIIAMAGLGMMYSGIRASEKL